MNKYHKKLIQKLTQSSRQLTYSAYQFTRNRHKICQIHQKKSVSIQCENFDYSSDLALCVNFDINLSFATQQQKPPTIEISHAFETNAYRQQLEVLEEVEVARETDQGKLALLIVIQKQQISNTFVLVEKLFCFEFVTDDRPPHKRKAGKSNIKCYLQLVL